jgi:ATP dependent DNA ligase C terminal region
MPDKVLADLRSRLEPLARAKPPLSVLPPRKTRFGSPLVLSRVHWVEPRLVVEITFLTWTADNLLRHTVYVGLREDKPAERVRREAATILASETEAPHRPPRNFHRRSRAAPSDIFATPVSRIRLFPVPMAKLPHRPITKYQKLLLALILFILPASSLSSSGFRYSHCSKSCEFILILPNLML